MYQIVATDGRAKSAHMETVHGVIETPVFMNVGTDRSYQRCGSDNGSEGDRYTGGTYPIPIIFMFVRETRL